MSLLKLLKSDLKKNWRKSWFCIQKLNETNLIDVGSTKLIWTNMWFRLFNDIFESNDHWNVFNLFVPISQIFGPN